MRLTHYQLNYQENSEKRWGEDGYEMVMLGWGQLVTGEGVDRTSFCVVSAVMNRYKYTRQSSIHTHTHTLVHAHIHCTHNRWSVKYLER